MDDKSLHIESIARYQEHLYVLQQKHGELETLIRTGREAIEQSYELVRHVELLLGLRVPSEMGPTSG